MTSTLCLIWWTESRKNRVNITTITIKCFFTLGCRLPLLEGTEASESAVRDPTAKVEEGDPEEEPERPAQGGHDPAGVVDHELLLHVGHGAPERQVEAVAKVHPEHGLQGGVAGCMRGWGGGRVARI